ncbi:hypothetical protein C7212DRAFT_366945 [Tuber magnatum]|uniref:C3H1-type domain-containing protein n=1 Tax=Tuber magnatum TaxID=42249 RepID=A0A317SC50_9PEZI|nr:hypothetical protein C7212DRAFT_366945 [Tuber magnatum]
MDMDKRPLLSPADNSSSTFRSLQRKTETNTATVPEQDCQDPDTAPERPSVFLGDSLFHSGGLIQSSSQPPASALDEASRDAETFGNTESVTFNSRPKHPMPFYNGRYQPAEEAGPSTPYGHPTTDGNSFNRLADPDSSPIFANTVLSESVRKRFLFTKNQRPRPTPVASEESSVISGHNRPAPRNYRSGDFVNYGASAMFKGGRRLEDIHEEFAAPDQGTSDNQSQNLNLSYNTPMGPTSKRIASIPSPASTLPPSFVESHKSGGHGIIFQNPVASTRDRQALSPQSLGDQDCGEGSKFLTEPLVPFHSFSPEKLVPHYPLDGSASSFQKNLPSTDPLCPAGPHAGGRNDRGLAGASQELSSVEYARNMTTSRSLHPSVEEFIARQSANARPRPPYWQTQCYWTTRPFGEAAGGCRYGRSCLYGHDGDVYEDNLSVYYTFENGRTCPTFVSQVTPGPPLGGQGLCSPSQVDPDAKPQPQTFHVGHGNRGLRDNKDSNLHNSPSHSHVEGGGATTLPSDLPWLRGPQHGMLGRDQSAVSTEASLSNDETLFRLEPRVSVADFVNYFKNEYPSLTIDDLIAAMEAQCAVSGENTHDHVQGN